MEKKAASSHSSSDDNKSIARSHEEGSAAHSNGEVAGVAKVAGVAQVEAFNRVLHQSGRSGKILLWLLATSIMLTMVVYAFDQGLTFSIFSTLAASTFGQHSKIGTIQTASQIIRAVSKPFIGKLSDITSRPTTYVVVLVFYVVGFIVAASATGFPSYVVGLCFTAVGKSGLDLLSDIIVGDLTPLEWRGFFSSLISVPFLITVPISGFITTGLEDDWRWGLGMFAIMVPVLLTPAIVTLYVMQNRARKMGMVSMAGSRAERTTDGKAVPRSPREWLSLMYAGLVEVDFIGLIILAFAFALILLPFSLAAEAQGGWSNPSMIAMLVIGFVLLGVFTLFEVYLAPKPLMTGRIIRNRAFLAAVTINVFNQMSSSVRNTYFSSYIYVIKDWSPYVWTIFVGITTMGLSLVSPFVGLLQRYTHRYKTLMMVGASIKILAYGLLVNAGSNTMTQDTARLTAAQLLFCGSALGVVGARVGAQASVPHEDMATLISLISLWSTLGSSFGAAISSAIWTEEMLERMYIELPNEPAASVRKYYGSIKKVGDLDFNGAVRQGVIRAYSQTNGLIAITALVLAAIPLLATLAMPDFYLGKQQNAITNTGLDGEAVDVPRREEDEVVQTGEKKWYHKMRDVYRKDVL